jgi:hypothetical protein
MVGFYLVGNDGYRLAEELLVLFRQLVTLSMASLVVLLTPILQL